MVKKLSSQHKAELQKLYIYKNYKWDYKMGREAVSPKDSLWCSWFVWLHNMQQHLVNYYKRLYILSEGQSNV